MQSSLTGPSVGVKDRLLGIHTAVQKTEECAGRLSSRVPGGCASRAFGAWRAAAGKGACTAARPAAAAGRGGVGAAPRPP